MRNNISSLGQIVTVISEQVVLLRINYGFYYSPSLFTLILQDSDNHIHNLRNEGGESGENSVDDALCHLLKHVVHILEQVEGRLSQFLKLGLDEIDEHVN